MQLTQAQRSTIISDGYVRVPGAIPRAQVDAVVRAINHDIGKGMDPAMLPTYRVQSYCPSLLSTPLMTGLFNDSPAMALCESALGAGRVKPVTGSQIALRFPGSAAPPATPPKLNPPHVDGIPNAEGTNGVPKDTISNFTALACILLSDLPEPMSGNFMVWPGTHRSNAAHLRAHGSRALLLGMPKTDLPEPVQITGRAGDLIIAHYLLGHSVAPHLSPHIRYACFFRVETVDHEETREASLTDEWLEWHGLRDVHCRGFAPTA